MLMEEKSENSLLWSKRDSITPKTLLNSTSLRSRIRDFAQAPKLKLARSNFFHKYLWEWPPTVSSEVLFKREPEVALSSSLENYSNKELNPWNSNKDIWFIPVNQETTMWISLWDMSSSNKELWVWKLKSCFLMMWPERMDAQFFYPIMWLSMSLRLWKKRNLEPQSFLKINESLLKKLIYNLFKYFYNF